MPVLQPLDNPRQVRVRVRPFVDLSDDASRLAAVIITDLIGRGDEQGEQEDVAVPSVVASDVLDIQSTILCRGKLR
jgi:hypothetical protein